MTQSGSWLDHGFIEAPSQFIITSKIRIQTGQDILVAANVGRFKNHK